MTSDLKKEIEEKGHVMGFDRVRKGIVRDQFSKVCVASNCKDKNEIENLCRANNTQFEGLEMTNWELATLCKKTYSIGVIGFNKK